MYHVFKGRAGGIERLLDAIHGGAGLSLEIVDHVLLDLISFVRIVLINWQGCGPAEPKNLSALDLNGRHEHVRSLDGG